MKSMEKSVVVFTVYCKHAVIGVDNHGRGSSSKFCFRCGGSYFL